MAQELINLGTAENSGNGDKVRLAFGKINAMFTEVYGLLVGLATHVHAAATSTVAGFMAADKAKLDGIAPGATANQTDAYLRARANHTGTQAATTIIDFAEAVDDRVATFLVGGTGVALTYDDTAGTLTIAAAGAGGGTSTAWIDITGKPTLFPPPAHTHLWADLTDKPASFAPSAHTHAWTEVTGKPATFAPSAHTHLWADTTDKPASFPPAAHQHPWADITGKPATFAPEAHTHAWTEVTGKPATFAPSAHTHLWTETTDKPEAFPPAPHEHSIEDVGDLREALDARVRSEPGVHRGIAITNTFIVTAAQKAAYDADPPADHATTRYIDLEA